MFPHITVFSTSDRATKIHDVLFDGLCKYISPGVHIRDSILPGTGMRERNFNHVARLYQF
jgi:hypothetical protein